MPVRIGVLGCADVAWRTALPTMAALPSVHVTAVASRTAGRAERFAGRFGAAPVTGYEALLGRDDVEAVYLPLPTGLHREWAERALAAGKHVLVEKSLATGLAEAEALVAAARRDGLVLAENFTFVHHGQHAAVRALVDSGAIGTLRGFSAAFGFPPRAADDIRYRADLGGGALLDAGAYLVRAARLFTGPGLEVAGAVLRIDRERGVDIGGSALLCSPDGVPAELTFSFQSSYRSTYALWGSEGRITLQRAFITPPTLRPVVRIERQDHVEERTLAADDQFAGSVAAFAAAVRSGEATRPGAAARAGADLLDQARLVQDVRTTARHVTVDPLDVRPAP